MKSKTSLSGYGKRIVIKPARSSVLHAVIFSVHLTALILLFFSDLDPRLLFVPAGFIVLNYRQYITSEKLNLSSLSLQQGGPLLVQKNSKSSWQGIIITESFVTSWIIVLTMKSLIDSKRYRLVYAADAMSKYSYRQLVIYLNQLR